MVCGGESVGKTQLLASLTGKHAIPENFRGSTISCETYHDRDLHWTDTPGIVRESETAATRSAITRPILANGFHSGLGIVSELFEHNKHGNPIFTEEADESTLVSGLFYSGPALVHRNALFCFIYKFRARFGVIAAEIAHRLGKPDVDVKLIPYAKAGFMNTDLDCCTTCECAIDSDDSDTPEPASFEK